MPTAKDQRILIVDDDEFARATLEALLFADYGTQLLLAASGAEALSILAKQRVDLILCDVNMPGMDGFEVCRAVKAHADWRFIPIVLITALNDTESMLTGLAAGADEFLTKPVDSVALRARVRVMLRIRTQYREARRETMGLEAMLRTRRDQLAEDANLTEREVEVLDLLLLGRTLADIGTVLGISPRTAKFHQANLLEKLGADSRMDLLRLFV